MTEYTEEELNLRNGVSSLEIWVAYKGFIYDVSTSPLFEKGRHYRHVAGKDLTKEMEDAPHLDDVLSKFEKIGILVP